jgi:hypothetical protein
MSLLTSTVEPGPQRERSRIFWLALGAVVVAQLFAFWLLCSHQVRRAEARQNVVNQMALSDCLQYIPGSTIASCTSRHDPQAAQQQPAGGNNSVAGAVPVSFSYR